MNSKELLKYKDELPKDMYVLLIKPRGTDGIDLGIFDTHTKGKNYVDLSYALVRGILSYLANDMEVLKERGQSVILEELKNAIDVPIIDDLIDRRKKPKNVENVTYLFGDGDEKDT
jgi:hypothetical protein